MCPTRWTKEMEQQLIDAVRAYGYEWNVIQSRYFSYIKLEAIQNKWFTIKRMKNLDSLGIPIDKRSGEELNKRNKINRQIQYSEEDPTEKLIDRLLRLL